MLIRAYTVFLALLVLAPRTAFAEPITFGFEGVVNHLSDHLGVLDGSVVLGGTFTGSYTFDPSVPISSYGYRFTQPPNGIQIDVGNYRFQSDPLNPDFRISVYNRPTNGDWYTVRAHKIESIGPPIGLIIHDIAWWLYDAIDDPLSDNELPTYPLDLDRWASNVLMIQGVERLGPPFAPLDIRGEVTSLFLIPAPNAFQCYEVSTNRVSAGFEDLAVDLSDQFGETVMIVTKPKQLCAPVDVDGAGIGRPESHLLCYDIDESDEGEKESMKSRKLDPGPFALRVSNSFGDDQILTIKTPQHLCVPSTKVHADSPDALGDHSALGINHYLCYRADTTRFDSFEVSLSDQFGDSSRRVVKPKTLCTTVDKNGEGVLKPEIQLACYDVGPPMGQHGPRPLNLDILVSNQFDDTLPLTVKEPRTLCVPSFTESLEIDDLPLEPTPEPNPAIVSVRSAPLNENNLAVSALGARTAVSVSHGFHAVGPAGRTETWVRAIGVFPVERFAEIADGRPLLSAEFHFDIYDDHTEPGEEFTSEIRLFGTEVTNLTHTTRNDFADPSGDGGDHEVVGEVLLRDGDSGPRAMSFPEDALRLLHELINSPLATVGIAFREFDNDDPLDDLDEFVIWSGPNPMTLVVTVAITPAEQVENLLWFLDSSATAGSLTGSGTGRSGEHRLGALRNRIETAHQLVETGQTDRACSQLATALERTDGGLPPPDFVEGEAAPEVAARVQALLNDLGCDAVVGRQD